jgi:glycine dehydrogenase subunit 1
LKNPFVPVTPTDEKDMLARIGASSIDEIFHEQIPEEFAFVGTFDIPPALSEMELQRELPKLAGKNATTQSHGSF